VATRVCGTQPTEAVPSQGGARTTGL